MLAGDVTRTHPHTHIHIRAHFQSGRGQSWLRFCVGGNEDTKRFDAASRGIARASAAPRLSRKTHLTQFLIAIVCWRTYSWGLCRARFNPVARVDAEYFIRSD